MNNGHFSMFRQGEIRIGVLNKDMTFTLNVFCLWPMQVK